jgi:hypothetical protein
MAKVVLWTVVALILGAYLGAVIGSLIADATGASDAAVSNTGGICGFIGGMSAARTVYAWRKSKLPTARSN